VLGWPIRFAFLEQEGEVVFVEDLEPLVPGNMFQVSSPEKINAQDSFRTVSLTVDWRFAFGELGLRKCSNVSNYRTL
jgi:hypothetical protein